MAECALRAARPPGSHCQRRARSTRRLTAVPTFKDGIISASMGIAGKLGCTSHCFSDGRSRSSRGGCIGQPKKQQGRHQTARPTAPTRGCKPRFLHRSRRDQPVVPMLQPRPIDHASSFSQSLSLLVVNDHPSVRLGPVAVQLRCRPVAEVIEADDGTGFSAPVMAGTAAACAASFRGRITCIYGDVLARLRCNLTSLRTIRQSYFLRV